MYFVTRLRCIILVVVVVTCCYMLPHVLLFEGTKQIQDETFSRQIAKTREDLSKQKPLSLIAS